MARQQLHYPVGVRWSDEDDAFIAEVFDLPGCMGDGPTPEAAVRAAMDSAKLWIEVAKKEGRRVPAPPATEPPSGKFNLRLPVSLHASLQERARRERVSLNTLVVTLLAERPPQRDLVDLLGKFITVLRSQVAVTAVAGSNQPLAAPLRPQIESTAGNLAVMH